MPTRRKQMLTDYFCFLFPQDSSSDTQAIPIWFSIYIQSYIENYTEFSDSVWCLIHFFILPKKIKQSYGARPGEAPGEDSQTEE